ncbi:hypothetical protein K439DRAFT_1332372 [Ramaria rubella]|nr:hypothetical protein K439DRAFT_1332372 [Ramaria rubella]
MRHQKGHAGWEGVHYARRLCANAKHVLEHGFLPESRKGKGATHTSLLDRNEVKEAIKAFIKWLWVGKIKPQKLRYELNNRIFASLGFHGKTIAHQTAWIWLKKLGYTKHWHRKGIYVDGHERKDVVRYQGIFLEELAKLEQFIIQYNDVHMDPLPLQLPPGQRQHHFIFQDELTFHANDLEDSVYLAPGEQELQKKGRGRLVHVSDFVIESTGRLVLPPDTIRDLKQSGRWMNRLNACGGDACKIIYPGKNYDAWWDMKQLLQQVNVAIEIFQILHPRDVAVFFFDCSSAHEAFAPDALCAQKMNVKPGRNQPHMHSMVIPLDCPAVSKCGTHQSMVFTSADTNDPQLIGKPKGMARICEEHGLTQVISAANKGRVVGTCLSCKMSATKCTKLEEEA